MSTNSNNRAENQEVDLSMISKGIGNFFQSISAGIFKAIQFVVNHIVTIGILLVVGVAIGVYLDRVNKAYEHQIIVQPNFGSTDYLYAKVYLLESKIKERDTVFLKKIGIENPRAFASIEVRPIVDVYRFISSGEQNFELLKLMSEDGDIKRIVEERVTSKNYPYHLISFSTKKKVSHKNTVEPLLAYLSDSKYFAEIQKEYVKNLQVKIDANELTISQINNFLNGFSGSGENGRTGNMVYYNENSPLNAIVETKGKLVRDQGNLRIEMVATDKVIKENSNIINVKSDEPIVTKWKFVLPLLFVFIYVAISNFRNFYQSQRAKYQA